VSALTLAEGIGRAERKGVGAMNTSSRVPGVSRNSGWQAVDAVISAGRALPQLSVTTTTVPGFAGAASPSYRNDPSDVPVVASRAPRGSR
jgi:hypothetical protein